jgi:hypothetical protein
VAHFVADLQDDVPSGLEWDERALTAHAHVKDDAWLRAGDPHRARGHLDQASAAEAALTVR